ncbi:MAG: hypothetical protein KME54_03900 [Tolypothrix brevis GSE-NOS-MK-07-07A]|jgi:hypothetical protein|nr:hypothetical protein [Tolypothrix brevis GSE-NOS-MK-07-07A]
MPHPDEKQVIRDLEDWNMQAAAKFKDCINTAKTWRSHRNSQDSSEDAFSNVMNREGCDPNLPQLSSCNPELRRRAQTCLNYYKNNS